MRGQNMKEYTTVTIKEENQRNIVRCAGDATLLEAIIDKGHTHISSPCGGNGLCGKCLIRVLEGDAEKPHLDELRLLTQKQLDNGLRLACRMQAGTCTDLTIELVHREEGGQVAVTYDISSDDISPGQYYSPDTYGFAVDIGTTTVVVFLVKLDTQKILGHASQMNSQRVAGGDVISRIQYVQEHEEGLGELQGMLIKQLESLMKELLDRYSVAPESIHSITAVGNPTMIHLFTGVDPSGIATAPFTPAFTAPQIIQASKVGFTTSPNADLVLPGFVSAYIGSDITVGVLSSSVRRKGKAVLFIDIGTNGEIVLSVDEKLYSCSSAAGPAFEGASIYQGMGAFPGAIDHLWVAEDQSIDHSTIGGITAQGICGSGIIDIMAVLLKLHLVDETGALNREYPEAEKYFVDSLEGSALRLSETVVFTHKDVREVQLAKAAIAAGIDVLLEEAELTASQLDSVIIAGGFGSYIDTEHAQAIGLLPPVDSGKIVTVGNAAGKGALELLMNPTASEQVELIRKENTYIELSLSTSFQDRYIEHMMFLKEDM